MDPTLVRKKRLENNFENEEPNHHNFEGNPARRLQNDKLPENSQKTRLKIRQCESMRLRLRYMASLLEEKASRLGDILQVISNNKTLQTIPYRDKLGDINSAMEKEQYYDSTYSRNILNTTYPNRRFEDEYLNHRHTEVTSEVPAYQEPYNNSSQTQQMQSQESPEMEGEECGSPCPMDLSVKKQDTCSPLHTQAHNMPRIFFSINKNGN